MVCSYHRIHTPRKKQVIVFFFFCLFLLLYIHHFTPSLLTTMYYHPPFPKYYSPLKFSRYHSKKKNISKLKALKQSPQWHIQRAKAQSSFWLGEWLESHDRKRREAPADLKEAKLTGSQSLFAGQMECSE